VTGVTWLLQSFRLRIFAITALIVAALLGSVVALGWSRVFGFEVQRLDQRLCGEARRLLNLPPAPGRSDDLRRLEDELAAKLRLREPQQLLVRLAVQGQPPVQTQAWPGALDLEALDWAPAPGQRPPRSPSPPPPPPREGRPPPPSCELAAFTLASTAWRAARVQPRWGQALVAADTGAVRADMRDALARALGLVLPLALLLTAAGAWLVSAMALRPVARLSAAMQTVNQAALDQRLPTAREDREFRGLIAAYNTMLDRLQASFQQATRFSADAAHELKTPLTILQGQIERAIQDSEHRDIQVNLGEMADELSRLSAITRKLLLLSQADAGRLALLPERLDFSALLEDMVADLRMSGPGLMVTADIAPGLTLDADALLLTQVLNNLCSNALKYTPPAGWVHLRAKATPGGVELQLENACSALTGADRERFFERFHRGDVAHNRGVDGHGLGLSLSREIARAHGGELELLASAAEVAHLRLTLPVLPVTPKPRS
jgi:signal transduction histidine kinase